MSDLYHWIERDGVPVAVGLEEWAAWDASGARFLADDELEGHRVVTIFDGIDPMAGLGKPFRLFYGTAVFKLGEGKERKMLRETRHESRAEALAYHQGVCAQLAAGTWTPTEP